MVLNKKYLLLLFMMLLSLQTYATHLVGGEMTYERLAGNVIKVTLVVYRDDINGSPQAYFDGAVNPPGTADCVISFYDDNNNFLEAITQPFVENANNPTIINPELNPCQDEIPNIRTQRGVYTFNVNLNTINGYNPNIGVTLVYGRCCRNGIIDNLNLPGDQGFSAIVRVPPIAIINNSPTFNSFEQYLCAGRFNSVDFSATDIDGDSLYYSLCDPLLGLDPNNPAVNINDINAGVNYTNYGPPYNTVFWEAGRNAGNPFGGTMNLNSNTGIMGVTPANQGIYVMRVCVSEYRNGVFLSTVSRDFQYLISNCDFPDIEINTDANISQDPISGLYTIDADCNEGTIHFSLANNSGIVSYEWDFGDPSTTTDVSTQQNPSYFYGDTGSYVVTVIGYAADGCADTSRGLVVFYPLFEPGYSFVDSCLNVNVQFTDTSTSTSSNINSWTWNFGDPSTNTDTSRLENPSYEYNVAGTFIASLIVTTDKGCIDTVYNQITVHPLPEPSFIPSNPRCMGEEINLNNTSSIQSGTIQSYNWLIEGNIFNTEDVNYTFNTADNFPIQLVEISALGCRDTLLQNITINPLPTLNVAGNSPICPNTNVQLTATSTGNTFTWTPANQLNNVNINNPIASLETTPTTFYVDVIDANGCQNNDSIFIDLFALPPAEAGPDTSVCLNAANVISFNTTVELQASGGVTYSWSPTTGLNNSNSANTEASPTTTTTYTVEVTDTNGCINTDSVKVVVLNPALELIDLDADSLCFGDTVYVNVIDLGNVTTYTWSPAAFITNASVREPGFFPTITTDYTLETVNYCYLDRDSIRIEVVSPPPINVGSLDSICLGDAPYQLNAQPDNLEFYEWTTLDPSISDINIPNPTVSPITNSWYYIYAVDTIGSLACESNDSVQILVYQPPTLALQYPLNYLGFICLGDTINLTTVTNDGIFFNWSSNNGAYIANPDSAITAVAPIDTTVFYQTVTNIHACSTTDSIQINVQLPVTASISGDSSMCFGFYADLQANGGLYYQWYPDEDELFSTTSSSFTQAYPDSSIIVSVAVSNDCFADTAYHDITVHQLPLIDAGEDITIYRDETGFLNGSGAGTPLWYTEDKKIEGFVSNPNIFNPEMSPFNTTAYVLEITDEITACLNYDTAIVNVEVLTLLAFPTAFSPNGNGTNDFAHIIKYLNIKKLENISIYDRWGEEVFRTTQLDGAWDGTFKGRDVEIGTYMWVINAITKDNKKIQRKGNITVIR